MERTTATKDLHALYEGIYAKDKNEHFFKYRGGKVVSDAHVKTLQWLAEHGATQDDMLDFGCGEADFLGHAPSGRRRVGIDYSENALSNARTKYPQLELICGSEDKLADYQSAMDVVFSFGTLEHMPDPAGTLARLFSCAKPGGLVIASCPSFLNVRGVIWMALVQLWNVPMSLSDRHFLTVQDFREMAAALGAEMVDAFSVELETGQGSDFGRDMRKRLTNALRDARMDNSRVEQTVRWFERNLDDFSAGELSGAETVYVMKKR